MYKFDLKDFKLLADRILVERDPELQGLIHVPNPDEKEIVTAVVVAIGDKVNKTLKTVSNGTVACEKCSAILKETKCWDCGHENAVSFSPIAIGSRVFFSALIQGPNFKINGKKYHLLARDQVIGVLPGEKEYY